MTKQTAETAASDKGSFIFVEEGTANANTGWVSTSATGVSWTQFSGAGSWTAGNGLTQSGTTMNVGAGTGISVAADTVGIDTAVVVTKYAQTLSTSATSYVITHSLGTRDVIVAVYLNSGTYEEVEVDVERTSTTTVTLRFAVAPSANAYRVVVHA
jgi:hypothetical protein